MFSSLRVFPKSKLIRLPQITQAIVALPQTYTPSLMPWAFSSRTIRTINHSPPSLSSSIEQTSQTLNRSYFSAPKAVSANPTTFNVAQTQKKPVTTRQQRKMSSRRNDDDSEEFSQPQHNQSGKPRQQNQQQQGDQPQRPEQIEVETYRHKSRHILPPELRGQGFTFRKGLAIPKPNQNHWLNTMVLEPYIAFKGNMLVWWDTQVRFTRLGFVMLHVTSLAAAILISYKAQDFYWVDYEDNMDRARHLYMIDVARLLWLQTAIHRCELVIQQRPNGLIPGLLLPEAIADQRESPFKTASYRNQHDISNRLAQWQSELEKEEKRQAQFRREMWGDKTIDELNELEQRKLRQDQLRQEKLGARPAYDQTLQDTNTEIKTRLQSQTGSFRDKYINSRLKVE